MAIVKRATPKTHREDDLPSMCYSGPCHLGQRFEVDAFSTERFSDLKRQMPDLERKLGMQKSDYVKWLRDRKRQYNISNMIHFINWIAKRDV